MFIDEHEMVVASSNASNYYHVLWETSFHEQKTI
jgi:hypothetical protein